MEVIKKYKIYSHLFYGYILIYHFFWMYVMKLADIRLTSILTTNETLGIFLYITVILFNKSRLYYREIKEEEFWLLRSYGVDPSKMEQILAIIKSVIVNFFYILFHYELINYLISKLENTDGGFVFTVLNASYFVFPILLIGWDIIRFFFYRAKNKEKIKRARQEHLEYAEKMEKHKQRQLKPEMLGEMTGYEPRELKKVELVPTSLMKGEPGAGLSGSSFSIINKKVGALGELNFAKALQKNDFLKKFATYWSVQYPFEYSPGPDADMQADIDCILISNKHIYLVDLKFYFQGDITWKTTKTQAGKSALQAIDNITGNWVGEPREMSKNMYYATERIQSKIDHLGIKMKVKPYVVMMPTDRGLGKVENVFWPGEIECLTLIDFLKIIEKDKSYDNQTADAELLDSVFAWLTKDESGSAPRIST